MMNRQRTWTKALLVAGVFLGLLLTIGGLALANGGYELSGLVAGGGDTSGTGGSYSLRGSAGQHEATDQRTGGSYRLYGGWWNPGSGGPTVVALARFVARSAGGASGLVLPLALVAVVAVGGVLVVRRRRR
jgi:hypothetical protein